MTLFFKLSHLQFKSFKQFNAPILAVFVLIELKFIFLFSLFGLLYSNYRLWLKQSVVGVISERILKSIEEKVIWRSKQGHMHDELSVEITHRVSAASDYIQSVFLLTFVLNFDHARTNLNPFSRQTFVQN
jgi:hypothetical protein